MVSTVTHHTLVTAKVSATGAKSSRLAKLKDKKDTKTKEFTHKFQPSEDNYLALMKTILSKHDEEQFNITAKMVYAMKVQLPRTK